MLVALIYFHILFLSDFSWAVANGVICDTVKSLIEIPFHSLDPAEIKKIRKLWNPRNFTDPLSHDPNHFTYLVATYDDWSDVEKVIERISVYSNRTSISASLISENHTKTFFNGNVGYILKAPEDNIIASNTSDMVDGFGFGPDIIQKKFGLHSPDYLLKNTAKKSWNEIRVSGTEAVSEVGVDGVPVSRVSEVTISGIFYKAGISDALMQTLTEISKRTSLPLVLIP